jgi:hypothetical protein
VPPPLLPGMHRGAPPQAVSPVPITRRICPTTAPHRRRRPPRLLHRID